MVDHDTVLHIARELNVDSVFVREALRRHSVRGTLPTVGMLQVALDRIPTPS